MKALIYSLSIVFCSSILSAQEKTRIYITDRPSWEIETGQGDEGSVMSRSALGQDPLINKSMALFHERKECKDFTLVLDRERADYAFIFDGRTTWAQQNITVVVVEMEDQGVIYAGDAIRHPNVVKDACKSVTEELERR